MSGDDPGKNCTCFCASHVPFPSQRSQNHFSLTGGTNLHFHDDHSCREKNLAEFHVPFPAPVAVALPPRPLLFAIHINWFWTVKKRRWHEQTRTEYTRTELNKRYLPTLVRPSRKDCSVLLARFQCFFETPLLSRAFSAPLLLATCLSFSDTSRRNAAISRSSTDTGVAVAVLPSWPLVDDDDERVSMVLVHQVLEKWILQGRAKSKLWSVRKRRVSYCRTTIGIQKILSKNKIRLERKSKKIESWRGSSIQKIRSPTIS